MKINFHYTCIVCFVFAIVSCKKDNYDAPSITLNGRLVYNGVPINVEFGQVNLELWQPGFGKNAAIGVAVAQDGSYSSLLFNGDYKLTISTGQGPFIWKTTSIGTPDSIPVTIRGNQTLDVEVTPYYMIRDAQINFAPGMINSTFKVEKIINDVNAKDIERVTLYVNRTQFVSGANNDSKADLTITGTTNWNNVSLSTSLPTISPIQNYVFARIGVKISGVEDLIFSPTERIQTQ